MGTFPYLGEGKAISPGVILALLFILLMTQLFRVMRPTTLPYVVCLALSAFGLLAGEVIAQAGRATGPALGVLHPLADVAAISAAQILGSAMIGRRLRR